MYKLLTKYKDGPLATIQVQVNTHLDEGWELVGGIQVHTAGIFTHYTQAIYMEPKKYAALLKKKEKN